MVSFILFDSYLAFIKNSVGSNLFRNVFAKVNGRKKDVTNNGELSCAFFASSTLCLFRLIKNVHFTVDSTVNDLKKSGWQEIKKPKIGCVLVWDKTKSNNRHKHIGFYLGNNKAISNSSEKGHPLIHHWTFGNRKGEPERKIEAIYWHKKLRKGM